MVAFYIMLARPVGRQIFHSSADVFSSDANSWGHLWTAARPMPICRYRHRSSSPCLPVSVAHGYRYEPVSLARVLRIQVDVS